MVVLRCVFQFFYIDEIFGIQNIVVCYNGIMAFPWKSKMYSLIYVIFISDIKSCHGLPPFGPAFPKYIVAYAIYWKMCNCVITNLLLVFVLFVTFVLLVTFGLPLYESFPVYLSTYGALLTNPMIHSLYYSYPILELSTCSGTFHGYVISCWVGNCHDYIISCLFNHLTISCLPLYLKPLIIHLPVYLTTYLVYFYT